MNAIVLCAGYGTRLKPITDYVPKPLVRLAGHVLLLDVLNHLAAQGIERAVINGSWKADMVERYLSETELPLETSFQFEERPLGTAGAVRRALPLLGDEFVVLYGDNLTRQPLEPLLRLQRELDAELTMALAPTGQPSSKGIVLTEPSGRISSFREKPPDEIAESNLANSGMYICRSSVVSDLEDGAHCDFGSDVFPALLDRGRKMGAELTGGYTRDIGTGTDFLLACHDILTGLVEPYVRNPQIDCGRLMESDQSWDDISLIGTFWADAGSQVGRGCILENCVVLSGASVGCGCRLKNTLVMPGSRVPENTVADDKYLAIF